MEFTWNGLFTVKTDKLYQAPPTFEWDTRFNEWENEEANGWYRYNQFIQDDPELENYNVEERVNGVLDYVREHRRGYTTNHHLLTWGGDFEFNAAGQVFENLDKLIKYTHEMYGDEINMIYSTPACYAKAVMDAKDDWLDYDQDFFPYLNAYDDEVRNTSHWSGYYSSRPSLKQDIRTNSTLMKVVNHLQIGPYEKIS